LATSRGTLQLQGTTFKVEEFSDKTHGQCITLRAPDTQEQSIKQLKLFAQYLFYKSTHNTPPELPQSNVSHDFTTVVFYPMTEANMCELLDIEQKDLCNESKGHPTRDVLMEHSPADPDQLKEPDARGEESLLRAAELLLVTRLAQSNDTLEQEYKDIEQAINRTNEALKDIEKVTIERQKDVRNAKMKAAKDIIKIQKFHDLPACAPLLSSAPRQTAFSQKSFAATRRLTFNENEMNLALGSYLGKAEKERQNRSNSLSGAPSDLGSSLANTFFQNAKPRAQSTSHLDKQTSNIAATSAVQITDPHKRVPDKHAIGYLSCIEQILQNTRSMQQLPEKNDYLSNILRHKEAKATAKSLGYTDQYIQQLTAYETKNKKALTGTKATPQSNSSATSLAAVQKKMTPHATYNNDMYDHDLSLAIEQSLLESKTNTLSQVQGAILYTKPNPLSEYQKLVKNFHAEYSRLLAKDKKERWFSASPSALKENATLQEIIDHSLQPTRLNQPNRSALACLNPNVGILEWKRDGKLTRTQNAHAAISDHRRQGPGATHRKPR
jgi:hypothetical protein